MRRYVKKWINGYWVIFDRQNFENCQTCLSSKHADHLLRGGM